MAIGPAQSTATGNHLGSSSHTAATRNKAQTPVQSRTQLSQRRSMGIILPPRSGFRLVSPLPESIK